jgi:hypothetical protein
MNEVDEKLGEEILKQIEEWPTATCAKCGHPKPRYLFTRWQLKLNRPVCMMCRRKPRNRVNW